MEKIDLAVIGGGIVGIQIAYQALLRHPDWQVVLFEKERYLGEHSTGRNSGVMHAGLYYENGSLKHRLCLEGRLWWQEFTAKNSLPYNECGKYIVAQNFSDLESLDQLFQKAKLNSVPNIRRARSEEVNALKEKVFCEAALFSPHTGILDVAEALNFLKDKFEALGGIILPFNPIINIEKVSHHFEIETVTEKIQSQVVINSAGLRAIELRSKLGLNDLKNYWVKGNYLKTSQKNEFKTLIYPVPHTDLKGLGIHLTFDFLDQMKFGPNTEEIQEINYSQSDSTLHSMRSAVESLFKSIDLSKLHLDYAGIRSKILFEDKPYKDFWIQSPIPGYIECCGIESPGVTASPAIARYITQNWL